MFTPTRRAVLVALGGLPIAVLIAAARPEAWVLGFAWPVGVGAALLADALLARSPGRVRVAYEGPSGFEVGRRAEAAIVASRAPLDAEAALEVAAPLSAHGLRREADRFVFAVDPARRGEARIVRAWLRWQGPLRLVTVSKRAQIDRDAAITLDATGVREEAVRYASRHPLGETPQRPRGEGAEFEALREFQTGMDPRAVDWKHSARHLTLLARETRVERNQNVVLALDCGRLMSEPVAPGGLSRLDHAVTASLLTAYIALRQGDRAALFAYAARPEVGTGLVGGTGGYPALQRAAAGIPYSDRETNHTLGLHTLKGRLDRRSLIVVTTEFADTTTAELMVETLARLARDHLVLFVAFRDAALEAMRDAKPETPEDLGRAVVADTLLAERRVVLERIRRLGADVLEARAESLGPAVLNRMLAIRQEGRL